jgi:hypothetical protein
MCGRRDRARRDVEQLRGLHLRQTQDIATHDHFTLPFRELGELHQEIDLAIAAREMADATKNRQRTKDPIAPAMPFPSAAGNDEEPAFRLRDSPPDTERVLERVLKGIRCILRTRAHGDERPIHFWVAGFARAKPSLVREIEGDPPDERHLHVLKCRGWGESFRRRPSLALFLRDRLAT